MKFNITKKTRKDKNGKVIKTELWYSYTSNGKRVRKPLGLEDTKANRKFVENEIFPDLLVKIKNDELFKNTIEVPTVNTFIIKSLELHKNRRKALTQKDYVGIYNNHIKDFLGKRKLNEIKPSHIELWQNYLIDKGVSNARIQTIRTVLYTMYNDAIKDEIIDKNPLSVVKTPIIQQVEINPFTLDEILLILSHATGQFKNFYATAFFTGLRSGELIGLRWSDVDFSNLEIEISRRIKNGEIDLPKTKSSIRTIDILDTLLPYLQEQYKLTGHLNSYIFLNSDNEHFYDIKRIRETQWKRDLKAVGLDYRPIYHTRHSFTTLMLSNNEDILWVSNMLGHKDSTTTLSKYSRYIKRDKKKRATFLNDSVFQIDTKLAPSNSKVA
ncbi:MAG: tyrosine-type recombinase/integrase [Campylobacterota bacterium]|nr:tyrosine-type recombinase/integrase [Campylobacterota bacterium]